MEKLKIGITIGDVNGIGLEVILKTIEDERVLNYCTPIIYGSTKTVSYHKNIVSLENLHFKSIQTASQAFKGKVNVVNCLDDNVNITLGKATEEGGRVAKIVLESAAEDLHNGTIDVLITGPIHKEAMHLAGFEYIGHTEFLADKLKAKESLMFMVSDDIRIGLLTNHVAISQVGEMINKERIIDKLEMMNTSLKRDFMIDKPLIAVLGLNPHAGDGGTIGSEDEEITRPAIVETKKNGIMAFGPFPADGFFGSSQYLKFDGILAMYHDQGLIPFKSLTFGKGVNFTAGLDYVRTSPDHGTAFDIVGQNLADPSSFRNALFTAIEIFRNRKKYDEMHANPLVKGKNAVLTEEVNAD